MRIGSRYNGIGGELGDQLHALEKGQPAIINLFYGEGPGSVIGYVRRKGTERIFLDSHLYLDGHRTFLDMVLHPFTGIYEYYSSIKSLAPAAPIKSVHHHDVLPFLEQLERKDAIIAETENYSAIGFLMKSPPDLDDILWMSPEKDERHMRHDFSVPSEELVSVSLLQRQKDCLLGDNGG
ncbi:MAG: hypothetical protein ACOC32_03955 [Nanoarchaeota archaeon]